MNLSNIFQVLVWLQSSVHAHQPGSLQRKLSQKLLLLCAPSVFQAPTDICKFKLLTEHKHSEDVQLRRQVLIQAGTKCKTYTVKMQTLWHQCYSLLSSFFCTELPGRKDVTLHQQTQHQGKNGYTQGTKTAKFFVSFLLLLKYLDNAIIDMINLYKFKQLCPEAKNSHKTDKRFLMYIFGHKAGEHHSKYMPYKTRYWSILLQYSTIFHILSSEHHHASISQFSFYPILTFPK